MTKLDCNENNEQQPTYRNKDKKMKGTHESIVCIVFNDFISVECHSMATANVNSLLIPTAAGISQKMRKITFFNQRLLKLPRLKPLRCFHHEKEKTLNNVAGKNSRGLKTWQSLFSRWPK